MSFRSYASYKASGLESMPPIPSDWAVKSIGAESEKIGSGKTPSGGAEVYVGEGVLFIRSQNVYDTGLKLEDVAYITAETDEELRSSRVRGGDVLLNITGASLGRTCIVPIEFGTANVNQHVCIIRVSNSAIRQFIAWVLKSQLVQGQISMAQTGAAREGLNFAQISRIRFALPPVADCNQITAFLDRETAKIDALIAEQERLMELLKEKRQAVISHVVTKGLNPDASMNDSGVEWLGEVPAHWKLVPLRRSIEFLTDYEANGSFADAKENVKIDEGTSFAWYVRATDLENGRHGLIEGNRYCDEDTFHWLAKTSLSGGELLVAKRGEIGKVYIMPSTQAPATLAPNLYLIRLTGDLLPTFAWYWFAVEPGLSQLTLADKSTTIGALYKDDVKACMTLRPPISEQRQICEVLEKDTATIDELAAACRSAIQLLRERRTALISAAVTGQIDVRHLANANAA